MIKPNDLLFWDELPRAEPDHKALVAAELHERKSMLDKLKLPEGTKVVTKPKNPTYTENRDHCCWIIGYNACKARTLRRLNQFKRGTEGYAQWCYGWDAAYKERNLTDRRREPLPRDYANERLRSYLNKAKLPK